MATERIFDITGFSGGESDDVYKGPNESFYSGENIDVRKNLSGVQLGSKLTDTGRNLSYIIEGTTYSGDISCMVNLGDFGLSGILVCTSIGGVFLDGVFKGYLGAVQPARNNIIGVGYISATGYLYFVSNTFFGNGKIHKIPSNLSNFSTGLNFKEYTTSGSSLICNILSNNTQGLYISVGNKIIELDYIEVLRNVLVIDTNEKIVGFTQFQNNFRIYANTGNNGVQYIWSGIKETSYDYRQVWYNQPIMSIVNDGAYDYAILGFGLSYADLYLISGTQKQELRVNLEASSKSRIFEGFLSIREGMIFISGGLTGESNNYGIYTYGNYYPGTSKSLVQEYSGGVDHRFNFHCHSGASSFFGCNDKKVYKVDNNNPPTNFATSGYVVSHVYEGISWEEKEFKKMEVGFKLGSGTYFKIYVRKDIGDTWKILKTVDNTTYGNKKQVTIYHTEFQSLGLGNFNSFQIKLEMFGTTNNTPIIKRVTTFLQVVNQN